MTGTGPGIFGNFSFGLADLASTRVFIVSMPKIELLQTSAKSIYSKKIHCIKQLEKIE